MKNVSILTFSALTAAVLSMSGCGTSSTTTPTSTSNCDSAYIDEVLPSTITANKNLSASKVYGLDGKVVVTSGATLTIPAGTTVAGCTGKSFLVISQGAKIDANGTQASPITFTSQNDVKGLTANGTQGEWGTLAILGKAPINLGATDKYEADTSLTFGGTNSADNSGVLNYVVIKHTGYAVSVGKELNGLSLAGVGSGTSISNIAILDGSDDGIEIWGGTVNINGLYIYNASDDSLDTDEGYTGTVTNIYAEQNTTDKNNYDSSGMETGNDTATTTGAAAPTYPTVVNGYFKVTAGGISMKNDASMKWKNVTIERTNKYSGATATDGVITFRNDNVATTNSNHKQTVITDMSIIDERSTATYYSTANKDSSSTANPASSVWTSKITGGTLVSTGTATSSISTSATGIATGDSTSIWKGNAGNNNFPAKF